MSKEQQDYDRLTHAERQEALGKFLKMERLKASFRKGSDVSQAEMARRIGIAQGTYHPYENGDRLPEGKNLDKLGAFYGTVIYRICGKPVPLPNDKYLQLVAENWGPLNTDMRRKIADMVQDMAEEQEARSTPKGVAELTK